MTFKRMIAVLAGYVGARFLGAGLGLLTQLVLVRALSPPFRPPAPSQRQRIFFSRTEWVDVGYGGDPQHWQALQMLGGRWGGRFRVMQVADLPGAKQLWQCSQNNERQ